MALNKPTVVIVLLLVLSTIVAVAEQYRIYSASDIKLAANFVSAENALTELDSWPVKVTFGSMMDHLDFSYSEPKQRIQRLKVRLLYRASTDKCLTISLTSPDGLKSYYRCSGNFKAASSGSMSEPQVWETTTISPPGRFRLSISGEPGLTLQVDEVETKSLRSIASGPDFAGRLPVLIVIITLAFPLYWIVHKRKKVSQWLLVGTSVAILFIVEPFFAGGLLLFLTGIFHTRRLLTDGSRRRLGLFTLLLIVCVAFLLVFKYAPDWYYSLFLTIGGGYVGLPLGVSYFVFRLMHVIMEWYRSRQKEMSFREYLCYLIFFPTIPAGPIETVDGFYSKRLDRLSFEVTGEAITRILIGIFKKVVLVSMVLGPVLFQPETGLFDLVTRHPGAVPYHNIFFLLCFCLLYAYLDLSAYTDIAIGVGLLFGHRILENFNWPIFKPNIAEFWRSYHISLAEWCRNNVYFPVLMLTRYTPLALVMSMLTMGVWHHVNLNWTFWGLHHGLGLVWIMILGDLTFRYHSQFKKLNPLKIIWSPIRMAMTFLFAAGGTSLVFIDDIGTALTVYYRFFTFH